MDGISKKIYLELQAPTEDDNRIRSEKDPGRIKGTGD